MNAEQKRAWFILGVFALSCIAFVVLGVTFGFHGAWGGFGVFGLAGFAFLFRRREKPDERDKAINRRAIIAAGMISYATFILGCMGTWFVVYRIHGQEQIDVHLLGAITIAGGIACYMAHSITILVLYRRHMEADDA